MYTVTHQLFYQNGNDKTEFQFAIKTHYKSIYNSINSIVVFNIQLSKHLIMNVIYSNENATACYLQYMLIVTPFGICCNECNTTIKCSERNIRLHYQHKHTRVLVTNHITRYVEYVQHILQPQLLSLNPHKFIKQMHLFVTIAILYFIKEGYYIAI